MPSLPDVSTLDALGANAPAPRQVPASSFQESGKSELRPIRHAGLCRHVYVYMSGYRPSTRHSQTASDPNLNQSESEICVWIRRSGFISAQNSGSGSASSEAGRLNGTKPHCDPTAISLSWLSNLIGIVLDGCCILVRRTKGTKLCTRVVRTSSYLDGHVSLAAFAEEGK